MGRVLTIGLVCLAACGGDQGQRREILNDGVVCVRLLGSGAVEVDVVFRDCLTSCDVAQPSSCEVTRETDDAGAAALRVASRGVVETTGASVCSPGCGELRARCRSTDTFAPGTVTVRHGQESAELLLGGTMQCLF